MKRVVFVIAIALAVSGCASSNRHGMVTGDQTGIQYGSAIEKNIFVDASQFRDKRIKVTTRNLSGDRAYRITDFESELSAALQGKGYAPVAVDPFGVRFDVSVLYSGHVQKNMATEYAFLGAGAGGIAGYRSGARAGTAAGALAGGLLGSLAGSGVTDDTFIVVAEVSIGVNDERAAERTSITFSSSPPLQRPTDRAVTPFREVLRTKIAVYGGGRNVTQAQVAGEIRRRLVDIASNTL